MSKAYPLIFDGYADWELGYTLAELRNFAKVDVVTVGFDDEPVVSMGGLRVVPDISIAEIPIEDVLVFILPGGHIWEGEYPKEAIDPLLHRLEEEQKPIAGICAATTVLARAGLLRTRRHTSNSAAYLSKMAPGCTEDGDYVDSLAVRDRHVITGSGLGAAEFTVEIFRELCLAPEDVLTIWYDAFRHGKYPEEADVHS